MVDIARFVTIESCIDDEFIVECKQIAVVVCLLSFVCYRIPDLLSNVFNNNVIWIKSEKLRFKNLLLTGKKTVPMNFWTPDFYCFWICFSSSVFHSIIDIVSFYDLKH